MKTIIYISVIIIVIVGLYWGAMLGFAYGVAMPICNAQTADIGLPHRWSFWGGCQIQENGKWIPLENWRYFGE